MEAWEIDQIERRRYWEERPQLELPVPTPPPGWEPPQKENPAPERGVLIIQIIPLDD
jgi:hypothetical protein